MQRSALLSILGVTPPALAWFLSAGASAQEAATPAAPAKATTKAGAAAPTKSPYALAMQARAQARADANAGKGIAHVGVGPTQGHPRKGQARPARQG